MLSFVHVPAATILGELKPNGHRPGYDSGDPQTFKLLGGDPSRGHRGVLHPERARAHHLSRDRQAL